MGTLVASGESIAFVGAGASAGLYPLWNGLLRILTDETVKRGLATSADRDLWLSSGTKPQQAVRGIKQALGDGIYAELLRQIFGPRTGTDGNYFTPTHAALMRLRFRGYVTTNYDLGLEQARMRLRPDSLATGFATWKDDGEVWRWINSDVFKEQPCPILFAHGVYQRADTVVLGAQEYRDAYRTGPYRRLFEKLWGEESLVFVGFGFSDPWLDFLADEVITQTAARGVAAPQHVTIVGLREDEEYTPERRRLFQDQYNAEPLFYPARSVAGGGEDHSALLTILDELVQASGVIAAPSAAVVAASPMPSPAKAPLQSWVHETTEDERYVERAGVLERLDRWADDSEVRVIAVTGLGGLGKTSLIGHWLKRRGGAGRRPNAGLFYWSFYADRDVRAFVARLLAFAANDLKMKIAGGTEPVQNALAILESAAVLLVLDGLEVLQERPGTVGYGVFLDDDLRVLLDGAARLRRQSLVVLTSRFPFADLTPYLGRSLRTLDLDQLAPAEGAELLAACGVAGTAVERQDVSRRFEGHPLALRVFAATLASEGGGDPTRLVEHVFADPELDENDPLERKFKHLLAFYEAGLPRHRVALLGLVSLFRTPASGERIRALARGLPIVKNILDRFSDDALDRELCAISREHLLFCDHRVAEDAYSCHPILRDHFRGTLLGWRNDVASGAAGLLVGRPSQDQPRDLREIEPVLIAIELLLSVDDFQGADELYRGRLYRGQIFRWLPAPAEGMRCALGFVAAARRRPSRAGVPSAQLLDFYLYEAGLHAMNAGEFKSALSFLESCAESTRRTGHGLDLSVCLRSQSELCVLLGDLTTAETQAREALRLVRDGERRLNDSISDCTVYLADVLARQGRVGEAIAAFAEAFNLAKRMDLYNDELYSLRGVWWADLLLRLGSTERARALVKPALRTSMNLQWQATVARCHRILGQLALSEESFEVAVGHLAKAENLLRRGQHMADLPEVLLARADLERRRQFWDDARSLGDEALRLAAPRGMRLDHADALVLRARIHLDRSRAKGTAGEALQKTQERAQDDLDAALQLARSCGYAWAERDALGLLAETWQGMGNLEKALQVRRDAEALSARLADPGF